MSVSGSPSIRLLSMLGLAFVLGTGTADAQLNPYIRGPVLATNNLRGDYAAAGVGLRGSTGTGTITLTGIPAQSTVKEAILYWTILGDSPMPVGADTLNFNGNSRTGTLIGSTASPCQPMAAAYVFRADVTPWVTGNGPYLITGALDSGSVMVGPVAEGASLVVIYSNLSLANRDILVYEGAGLTNTVNATVTTNITYFDGSTPVTGSSICFIVADGETGPTDNAIVNGLLVGPNTFNGSDPPSTVDFWDTDSFVLGGIVPSGATSVTAQIQQGTDCMVWVASPFSITSPIPDVDIITDSLTPFVPRNTNFQMRVTASNNTGVNQPVRAQIDVFRQTGAYLGTMVNKGGTLPPMSSVQKVFRRRIPASVPPGLLNSPLYVLTMITNRISGTFIDDDYVVMYIQ